MVNDATHTILTVLVEIVSIAGSVLAVGAWIGKRFDKVQDKFDSFFDDIKAMQLESQKHVTFEHCHEKREACPCVQTIKDLEAQIRPRRISSNVNSKRRRKG